MDYGNLLTKAWNITWNHKFLIGLGVLAALGSGQGSRGLRGNTGLPGGPSRGVAPTPGGQIPDFSQQFGDLMRTYSAQIAAIGGLIIALLCIGLVIGLALWAVGRIATGGMINGVDEIESDRPSSFTMAWSAGWHKVWRLLGIGLIAGLPNLLMVIILVIVTYQFVVSGNGRALFNALSSGDPNRLLDAFNLSRGFWLVVLAVFCPFTVVSLILSALRTFADRACMTEDHGVFESYGRGWEVLRNNLGPAIILFLIQIGLGLALALVLAVPAFIVSLCCLLWPILLVVSGAIEAYFSTLWTVAWREWAGGGTPHGEPVTPAVAAS